MNTRQKSGSPAERDSCRPSFPSFPSVKKTLPMNNDIAIRVDNLGKMYRIGKERPAPRSILGKVGRVASSPFDWLASQIRGPSEDEICLLYTSDAADE